ncbi:MAG: hypothetical protein U9Q04_00260 [Campylobacterota bacterium]|nr:hypothetical protein [Campylobacterota bacterium]
MSTDILNILKSQESTNEKGQVPLKNRAEQTKAQPSLFDSLLSEVTKESTSKTESNIKENNTQKTDDNIKQNTIDKTQQSSSKEVAQELVKIVTKEAKKENTEKISDINNKSKDVESKEIVKDETSEKKVNTTDIKSQTTQTKSVSSEDKKVDLKDENTIVRSKDVESKEIVKDETSEKKVNTTDIKSQTTQTKSVSSEDKKVDLKDGESKEILKDETSEKKIDTIDIKTERKNVLNEDKIVDTNDKNSVDKLTDKILKVDTQQTVKEEVNSNIQKDTKSNNSQLIEKSPDNKTKNEDKDFDQSKIKLDENPEKIKQSNENKLNKSIDDSLENKDIKDNDFKTPVKTDISPTLKLDDANNNQSQPIVQNNINTDDIKEKKLAKKIQSSENLIKDDTQSRKDPFIAATYLSQQKKLKDLVSKEQLLDAKKNLENNKTLQGIKESAKILDLNLEDSSLDESQTQNIKDIKPSIGLEQQKPSYKLSTNDILFGNSINSNSKKAEEIAVQTASVKEDAKKEIDKKLKENVVEINVPKETVSTLQNKIIGAQQKMSSFMSDVARNMYLNYKPPLTAFRLNLNPANLGNISIIMRSSRADNSLNISMNMSNSSTMEAFEQSKELLHEAIKSNMDNESNVNLDFGMQNSDSNESFEQHTQNSEQNSNIEEEQENIVGENNSDNNLYV